MILEQQNNGLSLEQWVSKRIESLGASEVSPVCFGSKYTSNLEIWYQKVTGITKMIENIRTYTGKISENIVDQFYPYYEGTEDSVWQNVRAGKKLREVVNKNITYRNTDFNHITATPDRFTKLLYSKNKEIITEYKNTQTHVMKQWLPGLPLDNVIQVLVQLNVCKYSDGELFYYLDNRRFEKYELPRNKFKSQWQTVLDITTPFWESVVKARPLYNQMCEAKRTFNMKLAAEIEHEMQQLEPGPQYSQGYLNFINENYKARTEIGGKQAEQAEIDIALKYKKLAKNIDKLQKEKLQAEIDLKLAMKDSPVLDLGKLGNVSWLQYDNRKVFKVNIK